MEEVAWERRLSLRAHVMEWRITRGYGPEHRHECAAACTLQVWWRRHLLKETFRYPYPKSTR